MARNRRKAETNETAAPTSTNEDKKGKLMALTPDQIRAIYASRRTKGQYEVMISEFLNSGESGVSVKEVWPTTKDKKASTLKQGFDNAKDRKEAPEGSEHVDVIVDGDNVFLMNKVLLAEILGVDAEAVAEAVEA